MLDEMRWDDKSKAKNLSCIRCSKIMYGRGSAKKLFVGGLLWWLLTASSRWKTVHVKKDIFKQHYTIAVLKQEHQNLHRVIDKQCSDNAMVQVRFDPLCVMPNNG
jgi:hypothetical protein